MLTTKVAQFVTRTTSLPAHRLMALSLVLASGTSASAHEAITVMTCTSKDGKIEVTAKPQTPPSPAYQVSVKKLTQTLYTDPGSKLLSRDLVKGKHDGDQFDFTLNQGSIHIWAPHQQESARTGEGTIKLQEPTLTAQLVCQLKLRL